MSNSSPRREPSHTRERAAKTHSSAEINHRSLHHSLSRSMNTKSIKSFAALLLLGTGLSASMNPAKAD
ncbi:MAG: hypothetical protein ACO3D4_08925, partial [Vulcanococcus sp.]